MPSALSRVSWTDEALSIVRTERRVPQDVQCERGWRSLMPRGPFAFDLAGILVPPLADADISTRGRDVR